MGLETERKYLVKDKGRPKIVRFLSVHTYFVSFLAIKKTPFSASEYYFNTYFIISQQKFFP